MINKEKHQLIMNRILKDIYSDISISSFMGFKGGSCAYLFYDLPRFSVDLDFDLFKIDNSFQKELDNKITNILKNYGTIKDQQIKRYTIFFLLSYGDTDHNIKIEINKRIFIDNVRDNFEFKKYLGIPMLIAKKDYLFANKLVALTERKHTAMRDVYDIYFFAKNNWDINELVIKKRTGKDIKKYLSKCLFVVEKIKASQVLQGLGELIDEKEKLWVKNNLIKEIIFNLKSYLSVIRK